MTTRRFNRVSKRCKMCGSWFITALFTNPFKQKLCGSIKQRSGCAYIRQQAQSRQWAKDHKYRHNEIHRNYNKTHMELNRMRGKDYYERIVKFYHTKTKPIRDELGRYIKWI